MATFQVFKETALPGVLQPHSIYFVAPPDFPELVEIFVTNATASTPVRHVLGRTDVQGMIDASIGAANALTIVADIAARDALLPLTSPKYVYVTDATGDVTVASGGATYLYNPSSEGWVKTSEAESMDVAVTWAALTGKPSSTAAQIDAAVANTHTHPNKTQLDQIGEANGEMTYNGQQVKTTWGSVGW